MKFFMQFQNEFSKNWHYDMRKWRQTMAGFLIGFFKNSKNEPILFRELVSIVQPYILHLRKTDGKKQYQGDLSKIVQATLFLNRLFIRNSQNLWLMDTNRAKAYEAKTLGSEYVYGYEHCRVPDQEEINSHYKYLTGANSTESQQAQHLQNLNLQMTQDDKGVSLDVRVYQRR